MIRNVSLRRGVAVLVLAASLAPGLSIAQVPAPSDQPGSQPNSIVGALMGVACGASINVARVAPLPIVFTVTGVVCALMMLDAVMTADPR